MRGAVGWLQLRWQDLLQAQFWCTWGKQDAARLCMVRVKVLYLSDRDIRVYPGVSVCVWTEGRQRCVHLITPGCRMQQLYPHPGSEEGGPLHGGQSRACFLGSEVWPCIADGCVCTGSCQAVASTARQMQSVEGYREIVQRYSITAGITRRQVEGQVPTSERDQANRKLDQHCWCAIICDRCCSHVGTMIINGEDVWDTGAVQKASL